MATEASSTPEISVRLAIEPSSFALGGALPTISLMATSHATQTITIFTWPTLFNLRLAQKRKNFTCVDLTSGTSVNVEVTKGPKRPPFSRIEGSSDDEHFWTMEPGVPLRFEHSFALAGRPNVLVEGHRYHYAVSEGEVVQNWWYGSRADVMEPAGIIEDFSHSGRPSPAYMNRKGLLTPSGKPIVVNVAAPVEFEVMHHDLTSREAQPFE